MQKTRKRIILSVVPLASVMLTYNTGMSQSVSQEFISSLSENEKIVAQDEVLSAFSQGKAETDVIVVVRPEAGGISAADISTVAALQTEAGKKQVRNTTAAAVSAVVNDLHADHISVSRTFSYVNGFAATVTPEGLDELLNNPDVVSVEPNRILEPHLAQGIPLMSAGNVRGTYTGSGISIAICDTGIDTEHPSLGNGGNPVFNSKVIGGYDFGDNDSDPRPDLSTGSAHGTACAGIAAGDIDKEGDYIGGVAPGAKLYDIKISSDDTGTAWSDDMIAAWEWAVTHQHDDPDNPIMIISTSFGGGSFSSSCDGLIPAMTRAAENAVAAGITLFASSGNEGSCNSMAWPACISSVNSVGAVYDSAFGTYYPCVSGSSCAPTMTATTGCSSGWYATDNTAADMVASYSNSASFLDFFAPANQAYTADITGSGGYNSSGDYDTSFGGTSAASPYAAGAAAVLQSVAKKTTGSYLTPAEVKQYLTDTGDSITDSKVAVTKPRINLDNAAAPFACGTGRDLPDHTWRMTAPSCVPVPAGVNDQLGDDLGGTYGSTWISYAWDIGTQANDPMAGTDSLTLGVGNWMCSSNAGTMQLDGTVTPTEDCTAYGGGGQCFSLDLSAAAPSNLVMIGHPFPYAVNWGDVEVACNTGSWTIYSPSEAEGAGIIDATHWTYNGSSYDTSDAGTLEPQYGYWIRTLGSFSSACPDGVRLLFPVQ